MTQMNLFMKQKQTHRHRKQTYGDFPRGPVVKNSPSNAGDAGSIPGRGTKIPHAEGQLNPLTTTTEPARLKQRARVPQTTELARHNYREENPHTTTREKPTRHNERSRMPQRGSRVPQLRPDTPPQKKENKRMVTKGKRGWGRDKLGVWN